MGSTQRNDPEDLRTALIAAALDVLAEKPSSDLSLRELARRVGVTHPAAYHHFESKGSLLAAVAAHGFEQLDATMEASSAEIPDGHPLEQFVALGLGYIRFSVAHPQLFRLMFHRESLGSGDMDRVLTAATRSFQRVSSAVQAACADASNAPDTQTMTVLAWAAMHGLASLWVDGPLAAWSGEATLEPTAQRVAFLIGRLLFPIQN